VSQEASSVSRSGWPSRLSQEASSVSRIGWPAGGSQEEWLEQVLPAGVSRSQEEWLVQVLQVLPAGVSPEACYLQALRLQPQRRLLAARPHES